MSESGMAGICRLVIHRGMEPLQALGLSAAAEALYLDLLHNRETGRADLEAALCELTELGLVERSEGGVVVRPPRLAMGALAERHIRQAELARDSADLYSELWKAAAGKQDYLEVLPTYAASQAVLKIRPPSLSPRRAARPTGADRLRARPPTRETSVRRGRTARPRRRRPARPRDPGST